MEKTPSRLAAEVKRRRTFAIISHPDAGKTTLTEKLLLYGGAIHLAGSVRARKAPRHATSDWMELERQRGISVSTSVMQFEWHGYQLNLLDTPGHNDFSEDTYRTLSAVDSAVMLIDVVKGVEPQTIKLFQVCKLRGIPIFTFINKMDRFGKAPLHVLDEIEQVLGLDTVPMNWPVGEGSGFKGVVDRQSKELLWFEKGQGGQRAEMSTSHLEDEDVKAELGESLLLAVQGELDLLDEAANTLDAERFMKGELTPVFFGSAMTSFGIEPFLKSFVDLAPPPGARQTTAGPLGPTDDHFSGYVFKIQANMDPRHRDRIAFMRVASGRFERGMDVTLARTGKKLTLARSLNFLAQERIDVEEAFAGDIVGLWDGGALRIGDALCEGKAFEFEGIPRFSPEHFVRVTVGDPMKRKQLDKGLEQLAEEGAIHLLHYPDKNRLDAVLGAVGVLQFEVAQHRLKSEYAVEAIFHRMPFQRARWVSAEGVDAKVAARAGEIELLVDAEERPILLFDSDWACRRTEDKYPELKLIAAAQPARRMARRG